MFFCTTLVDCPYRPLCSCDMAIVFTLNAQTTIFKYTSNAKYRHDDEDLQSHIYFIP